MEHNENNTQPSGGFWPPLTRVCLTPDADGAAAGGGTDDGGAGVEPEVAAEGAQGAVDGGDAAAGTVQTPPAEQSWEEQALPQGHPGLQAGLRTWGELNRRYSESSSEARHWQSVAAQREEQIAQYLLQSTRGQRQQQPAAGQGQAASAGNNWWGFGSQEAWANALRSNPDAAFAQALQAQLQNPQVLQELKARLQPELEPLQQSVQEMQREAYNRSVQAQFAEFSQQFPEFAVGGQKHQQFRQLFDQDAELAEVARVNPRKAWRLAALELRGNQQSAQLKAQDTRLRETGARAGTARPGAGGQGVGKAHSFEAKIRQAAAQAAANGESVSEAQIQEAIQTARELGFERGRR